MIEFKEFKEIFDRLKGEDEIVFTFNNKENKYMIIKYDSYITFQRIGDVEIQSGEVRFNSLDELYNETTIDEIMLKNEWNNIEDIEINYEISLKDNKEEFMEYSK